MKIIYQSKLFSFWPLKYYAAIVLGRRMLTRYGENELPAEVLRHELVHQEQMTRHGVLRFYLLYVFHYVKNLLVYRSHWEAYYNIPFEREAYRAESSVRKASDA